MSNNDTICNGEILIVGTSQYNQNGIYSDLLSSVSGSVLLSQIFLYYQHLVSYYFLLSGDSIIVGGDIFTQTGVYTSILLCKWV